MLNKFLPRRAHGGTGKGETLKPATKELSPSLENYLKTIGSLDKEGMVRVTDIAVSLGVSKPSVLAALTVLKRQGFLRHEQYGLVILTKQGREEAVKIRERYDFLVFFLCGVLGVNPDTAKRDSCKLEHVLSEETLTKMKDLYRTGAAPWSLWA